MALTTIDDRGLKTPIDLLDNEKIRFGTGNDLEIYHNATDSVIKSDTNKLRILSDEIHINNNADGENLAKFNANGNVELYYDDSKKLETTSYGVNIPGSNHLQLGDNGEIRIGNEPDLKIYHDGTDAYLTNATGELRVYSNGGLLRMRAKANENAIIAVPDAEVQLYYDNSKKIETFSDGIKVYEDIDLSGTSPQIKFHDTTGTDYYHTINTDNNELRIFTSSGGFGVYTGTDDSGWNNTTRRLYINNAGKVGIGENSPDEILHINSGTANGVLKLESTDAGADVYIKDSDGEVGISASGDNLLFRTTSSSTERMRIDSSGRIGIGTTTTDKNDHSLLNVHRSTSDSNYMYFTNSTTGEAGSDGFTIGLDGDENALVWNRENTNMRFGTNATERMTILAAGGLTFNGDTAAANAIDDYEEGTFTPTIQGTGSANACTYTNQLGKYTKVGRLVTVDVYISWTAKTADTGSALVNGLPFAISSSSYAGGAFAVYSSNFVTSASSIVTAMTEPSSGNTYFYAALVTLDNATWYNSTAADMWENGTGYYRANFTYMA